MHPDIEVETKASATDLVTAVDKAVEDFIMTSLRTKFPEHRYTEEGQGKEGQRREEGQERRSEEKRVK